MIVINYDSDIWGMNNRVDCKIVGGGATIRRATPFPYFAGESLKE